MKNVPGGNESKGSTAPWMWIDQQTGMRVTSSRHAWLLAIAALCGGMIIDRGVQEVRNFNDQRQLQNLGAEFRQTLAEQRTQWRQAIDDPHLAPGEKVMRLAEFLKALRRMEDEYINGFGVPRDLIEQRESDEAEMREAIRQILIQNPLLMQQIPLAELELLLKQSPQNTVWHEEPRPQYLAA